MVVRVLCLHGQGVNSAIFRAQTAALREMLPDEYEFFFFDGAYECEPAPEVRDFFAPPYLTWYSTPTTMKVLDAHYQVRSIVARHGPFDAVLGFSQGAAVAASLLLHDELDGVAPTFRAAVFIGSPVPFSYRGDVGIDARRYFGLGEHPPNEHGRPTRMPPHLVTDAAYLRNPAQLGETPITSPSASSSPLSSPLPSPGAAPIEYQMLHASADAVRIRIPTGHVFGSRDKWRHHSKDLMDLCDAAQRTAFLHDGGHEVPRAYTEELCDVVETVFGGIGSADTGTMSRA